MGLQKRRDAWRQDRLDISLYFVTVILKISMSSPRRPRAPRWKGWRCLATGQAGGAASTGSWRTAADPPARGDVVGPRSAKELAEAVGFPLDRLYYHLRQLEEAAAIEVSGYRPLPGGKVERLYQRAEAEPPAEESSPEEIATFGECGPGRDQGGHHRRPHGEGGRAAPRDALTRAALRLTDEGLAELHRMPERRAERFSGPDSPGRKRKGPGCGFSSPAVDLEERPPREG